MQVPVSVGRGRPFLRFQSALNKPGNIRSYITTIIKNKGRQCVPNGPVVWGVAVCVRVGMRFCKVPVDGRKFSRPGEVVQMAESR